MRASVAVAADETGWRVAGRRQWLWVFVGDHGATVYLIAPGRRYEQARSVLGAGFDGVLERDGWAPYRRFADARHQTCLAHLLRRAGELIADSVAGQAKIPHAVRRLLLDALAVRDAHHDLLTRPHEDVIEGTAVEIDDDQLRQPRLPPASDRDDRDQGIADRRDRQAHLDAEIARLNGEIDALIARTPTHEPNRKLLKHLANEREHLLTFLTTPGIAPPVRQHQVRSVSLGTTSKSSPGAVFQECSFRVEGALQERVLIPREGGSWVIAAQSSVTRA